MERFNVKVTRTYTTWIDVDADSRDDAERMILEDDVVREKLYYEELQQMNCELVDISVYKLSKT